LYPYGKKFFSRIAHQDIFFIQAGANCTNLNDFIVLYGKKWRGYLLEPLPYAYKQLQEIYPHKDNKIIENIALSDHDGTLKLYCLKRTEENKDWYTIFASADRNNYYLKDKEVDEFEVPCYTLDTFLNQKNIHELDLLYMNIEGHELKILNAYSFRVVPKIMWLETRFFSFIDLKDFYEKMIDIGYRIFPNRDFCLMIHKDG
jgi:FkbM family methyltransferase